MSATEGAPDDHRGELGDGLVEVLLSLNIDLRYSSPRDFAL